MITTNNLSIGFNLSVSDTINNLLELPVALEQAEFALSNRAYISWFEKAQTAKQKWSSIVFFNDHFAGFMLNRGREANQIWQSSRYGKMLFKLHRNDLEKNTNNLEILYTFLINERRATETAAALYMHRNNVIYRIGRIEEMLGIKLEDPVTRLNLLVAFLLFDQSAYASITQPAPLSSEGAEYEEPEII